MKSLLFVSLLFSTFALAKTESMIQCRADAIDGAVSFATHMNRYTSQALAMQQCQASSRRPETCRIVSCF